MDMKPLEYYQALYDLGKSLNTICKECPEAKRFFLQKNLKFRSPSESMKGKRKGIALKPEHRQKLAVSATAAHAEGRHPGWKHINEDPDRMSYPERFLKEVLINNGLFAGVIPHLSVGKYFLDFAFIDLKLDLEVDGSQHFRTQAAIAHDAKRDLFLVNAGWIVYRISWKEMCANTKPEIQRMLDFINDLKPRRDCHVQ